MHKELDFNVANSDIVFTLNKANINVMSTQKKELTTPCPIDDIEVIAFFASFYPIAEISFPTPDQPGVTFAVSARFKKPFGLNIRGVSVHIEWNEWSEKFSLEIISGEKEETGSYDNFVQVINTLGHSLILKSYFRQRNLSKIAA